LSTDGRTDGHGETSIPPYNFVAGGIIMQVNSNGITYKNSELEKLSIVKPQILIW